jgi:hypothetical protein
MLANKWPWQLPGVLGKVFSRLHDDESGRTGVLAAAATMAGGGAACARRGAQVAFL